MSRFSLNVRVAVAVGLAMCAGIAAAGLLVIQLQTTSRDYDAILGEREVLHQDQARVVQLTFKKQVQEWKNLLLRGGAPEDFTRYANSFRAEANAARTAAEALLGEVMDAQARSILGSFIDAHGKMGTKYGEAIAALQRNGHDVAAADALVKGQDRAPTDLLDELAARLHTVVAERQAQQSAGVRRAVVTSAIVAALAFLAVLVAVVWIVRGLRRELLGLTRQLTLAAAGTAAGASEVANLAQSLSGGASEQAAALEETSASMTQLVAITSTNEENARDAAGLVHDVELRVSGSKRALAEMVAAMDGIEDSSQQVVKIIKTIDEIAFQTNILALNAAVEAARAGDAGLGFAVVASEVRGLAQRSAAAAKDTAQLIEESIERARAGTRSVVKADESIAAIAESVQGVKALVDEVCTATAQQTRSYQQVTQATAQMESVTQSTAASAEESAAASEELSAQAAEVMAAVHALGRLIGATTKTRGAGSFAGGARDEGPDESTRVAAA